MKPCDIEALRSKPRRIFDPQGRDLEHPSLATPRQAAGNALAAGFMSGEAAAGVSE
ncbi:MAG TPA: hypothetical protein PLG94_11480 [Smithellaceae bacterium]|nr:hypothetical protein [Smithellaceae bacterium]